MAAHPVIHPPADALRAFALGKANDSTAAVLMAHLDSCPDCCQIVAALSGDDFLDRLRQARGQSSTPAPPRGSHETAAGPKPSPSQRAISNLPTELANNPQYEILRELGRGGMGVVYLAKNKLMDRLEVLKVVNKVLLDHPGAVERFLREIRSAAKLSHANVVAAYHALQIGELLAFAMEYIEGQDLASVVKAQGTLPVPHACFYVQQAAHGLQHAFEKGMVHRDIKPQNLILAREGKKHIVKVLDFGLAKIMREKGEDTGLTGEGKMLGTPDYIAPEQTLDAAKADIRADIYSLGCTLYYLLSGRPPFSASSLGAILVAHQMHEAKPLNLVRPEIREELAAVVRKMMAKTPAKRYQTPLDVVQALAPFVKQGATPKPSPELSAGTVGAKPVVKKAVPVNPPPAPAADAPKQPPAPADVWGSLTEGDTVSVAPRKSAVIRKSGAATVRERRAQKKWLLGGIGAGVLLLALLGMWAGGMFDRKVQVKTKDGILVVEVNEPNPEILVDGETVTVTWHNGGKKAEIRVQPGTHKVEVKKDGFSVDGKDLTFKDGDRVVFTARLLPDKPEPKPVATLPDKSLPSPDPKKPDAPQMVGAAADEKAFVPLFNGKDLIGWSVDGGPPGQWVVEGNTIVGQSKDFRTRNYLLSDKKYADFILHFDYKVEDGSHGGVAIRAIEGEKVPLNSNLIFDHPLIKLTNPAVEGKEPTGMTHWLKSAAAYWGPVEILTLPTGIWHSMEVTVRGDSCTATVDGKKLVNVTLDPAVRDNGAFVPGLGRREGKVGFQINTGIVRFRKIEIKELSPAKAEAPPAAGAAAEDSGFAPLFNGKDLSGWKTHAKQPGNWRVENGILIGSGPAISHLYSDRGDYESLHLRVEARINDGGNSGVWFRTGFGPASPANTPNYPLGYEANIMSTNPATGSVYPAGGRPGTGVWLRASPVSFGEWFTMEVIAEGNHIVVKVNGKTTADYIDDKRSYNVGHIAFQSGNAQTVAEFRKIEIKDLPPAKAKAPPAAAPPLKDNGFVPLFNGKNLTGWKTHPSQPGNWRVEKGVLIGSSNGVSRVSHLYTNRGNYTDFHLRLKVRINDGGNSGVYLRAPFGPNAPANTRMPASPSNKLTWFAIYNAKINARRMGGLFPGVNTELHRTRAPLVQSGEWFTYEVIVKDNHIVIKVNDLVTTDYTDAQRRFKRGHLVLQQHNAQTVVEFRTIEIKEPK